MALQLRLAAGERLELEQDEIRQSGHAIECRLYAENPAKMFLPQPGQLTTLSFPAEAEGLRIDAGVRQGDRITPFYDPMIAKVIGCGANRAEAIERALAALKEIRLEGIVTNLDFLIRTLDHPAFRAGDCHTGFVEQHKAELVG